MLLAISKRGPRPLDWTSGLSLTVFASFELGPTLGGGEALYQFEIFVAELLDNDGESERE